MRRAIIIANGSMDLQSPIAAIFREPALIIAADGGTHNCKALGVHPDAIIGDLDSIDPQEERDYHAAGTEVIRYPTHKDETDLELALQYASGNGVDEIVILGALGARWDMTFANVLLAAHPRFAQLTIRFLDGTQELVVLRPGVRHELLGEPGETISLIPIGGDAGGVSTHGMEYPLNDGTLQFGSSRGVSNGFIQKRAEVSFTHGLILCVLDRRSQ